MQGAHGSGLGSVSVRAWNGSSGSSGEAVLRHFSRELTERHGSGSSGFGS